ncbi:von Willebrand factor type D protein [Seminavis robusta]|uniref:von Willebrand factor type D protein n=1 Tax=Seminavis robusta TaxID=568900 RepID=A0A9N8DKY0_9STRA|nr:von Willebrand factor type D protein [Seminavis robusta]|eukprot:Sro179_g078490.1 von Willebrand factor type D protein (760) ;mRNA; f:45049-47896
MMKFALASLLVASAYAQELHSSSSPKLMFFAGDDLLSVTNHAEADAFCKAKDRVLASKSEWCHYSQKHTGVQYGEVPVRGSSVYIDVEDHCDVCKPKEEKDEKIEIKEEESKEVAVEVKEEVKEDKGGVCGRPAGCTGRSCAFTCDLPAGYYPDPTDCSAYCFCTGSAAPSRWEQVVPGLVWDPFCGGSQPLDPSNKPLGGMTGGCQNWAWAVSDNSYCAPGNSRRRLEEVNGRRELKGRPDFMLCTKLPKAPPLPQTCAKAYDDPHIETFDQLQYDCQGDGDFILSKSLEPGSGFELQGRFFKLDGWAGTTTTGAVLTTGFAGEPKVEVAYNEKCDLHYYIDDEEHDLDSDWSTDGTIALGTDKVNFFRSGSDRYFHFQDSGVSFHVTLRYNHVFGCFINVKLCLPDEIKSQRLVGIFGSPDGNKQNDFMDHDGTDLETVGKIYWGQIYDYCTTTWCLGSDSLFKVSGSGDTCEKPYDDTIEQAVKNAGEEVKAECGDNMACMVDTVVSKDAATGGETLKDEEDLNGEETVPDEGEDDSDNADHCNGQDKTVPSAPSPTIPKPAPAPTPVNPPAPDQPTPEDQATEMGFVKGDPHFKDREWVWINGKANGVLEDGKWYHASLNGLLVRFKQSFGKKSTTREVNIYLNQGSSKEVLAMKTFKSFVRVDVDWKNSDNYDYSRGLLGSHAQNGKRLGRQCVLPPTVESAQKQQIRNRRLAESGITTEIAEKACAHVKDPEEQKDCVFDILATNDVSMASVW